MKENLKNIKAKKSLGQHFLTNEKIPEIMAETVVLSPEDTVLEIGPGLGILTKYLLDRTNIELYAIDIDKKIVEHLHKTFPQIKDKIVCGDFLEMNFEQLFKNSFSIIGNFPYNISSQILFKILDHYNKTFDLPNISAGAQAGKIGKIRTDGRYIVRVGNIEIVNAPAAEVTRGFLY